MGGRTQTSDSLAFELPSKKTAQGMIFFNGGKLQEPYCVGFFFF